MTNKKDGSLAAVREFKTDYQRQHSLHAAECYASSLRRLHTYLVTQGTTLVQATKDDLNGYLSAREDGGTPGVRKVAQSTVYGDFKAMRAFYTWAVEEDVLDNDPSRRVRCKPGAVPIMPIATAEDVARLMKACEANKDRTRGTRDAALLDLMWTHGLRRGEVAHLDVGDVDLDGDWLHVRDAKGGKSRRVPIMESGHKRLRRVLRHHPGEYESDPLFVGQRGNRLTGSGIFQALNKYAIAVGIPKISPHSLRRGNTADARARGISEASIMTNNGWSDRRMIDRYTKGASEELAADEIRSKRSPQRRLRAI